ncbi:MAG: SRPBCC domain-containing protein, partial [Chloroflexota bacterium]
MKVAGEYTFDAPQDVVWEALQDPEVLAAVMPGCEKLELVGEDEYEGILKIKVGPVNGKFSGKVKLEDITPPNGY